MMKSAAEQIAEAATNAHNISLPKYLGLKLMQLCGVNAQYIEGERRWQDDRRRDARPVVIVTIDKPYLVDKRLICRREKKH
jgi:hypothetical protein